MVGAECGGRKKRRGDGHLWALAVPPGSEKEKSLRRRQTHGSPQRAAVVSSAGQWPPSSLSHARPAPSYAPHENETTQKRGN